MAPPPRGLTPRRLTARLGPARTGPGTRWTGRQWAALVCVLSGYVVGALTMSGTAIALPSISAELGAGPTEVQWFVTGYSLATTCLVLVAGTLGDRFGRRLVLGIAASLYALGIGASALATSMGVLIAVRMVAGIGSAGLMACGAAVLASSFSGPQRVRAFALCGSAGGIGLAIGPSVAGWIVAGIGWRGAFAVLGLAALPMVLSTFFIIESRAERPRPFDVRGALVLVVGLSLLLLGISSTTSGSTLVGAAQLAGALVVLALFVVRSLRTAHPLLELALLRDRAVAAWLVSSVVATAGTAGFIVYLPTYLLVVHDLAPGAAGTWMLAYTVPLFLAPVAASRWVNAGGSPERVVAGALGLTAAGFGAFALTASAATPWLVLVPTVVLGTGIGALNGLSDAQLMGKVDSSHIGMVAGLLNTLRQGTMSVLLAVFGAGLVLAVATEVGPRTADRLVTGDDAGLAAGVASQGFGHGWAVVLGADALLFVLAGVAFVLLNASARRSASPAP